MALIGKRADQEDDRLVSQKTIFVSPNSGSIYTVDGGERGRLMVTVTCLSCPYYISIYRFKFCICSTLRQHFFKG